ncbi:MAG: protein tyrosine phosphatase family protein [Steroidobacteraceae bacterium]|nr:protein tyrosine phosphatase family protein [Steroidobacteraceae bacterium]
MGYCKAALISCSNGSLVTAGQPTRESLQGLGSEGYAAVISLAPGDAPDAVPDEARILAAQGIEYVHVPIPWLAPEAAHLEATAAALQRLRGRKVLVHCQKNMRASAVTFLVRVIHDGEDPAVAWSDVRKVWMPNETWTRFIDAQLRAHGRTFALR